LQQLNFQKKKGLQQLASDDFAASCGAGGQCDEPMRSGLGKLGKFHLVLSDGAVRARRMLHYIWVLANVS
jgi:hypothetical protein